jgi:hypothetical protein
MPSDTTTPSTAALVERIPPANVIRQRLADLAGERATLRQLLRLAVRAETSKTGTGGHHAPR